MPDHCCVPECKGNYSKDDGYVSVFQFPKDQDRKKLWCEKIPRKNFEPSKRSVVCEKHFRDEMIIREDILPDKNGTMVKVPRKRPLLKDDAYPCIFAACPSYLTEKPSMVSCVAFRCTSRNSEKNPGLTFHSFPKDEKLRKLWVVAVRRKNWNPTKFSKLCSKHFSEEVIDRTSVSCVRLRENAVPSIFDFSSHPQKTNTRRKKSKNVATKKCPIVKQEPVESIDDPPRKVYPVEDLASFTGSSTSTNSSLATSTPPLSENVLPSANPDSTNVAKTPAILPEKRKINDAGPDADESAPNADQVKLCRHTKLSMPSKRKSMLHPSAETSKETASPKSENVATIKCPIVKQEPVEFIDDPPRLVIEKVYSAEDLTSFTRSSTSINSSLATSTSPYDNSPPLSENAWPSANPALTNVAKTPAIQPQKRKINDSGPDADEAAPNAARAKFCRHTKLSMPSERKSKLHPSAETSEESATLTKNAECAAREMFQSLFDRTEDNPLIGSRTFEGPGDLFNVFGDFIALKLREMDSEDCADTVRTILDAVFKTDKVQNENEVGRNISCSDNKPIAWD